MVLTLVGQAALIGQLTSMEPGAEVGRARTALLRLDQALDQADPQGTLTVRKDEEVPHFNDEQYERDVRRLIHVLAERIASAPDLAECLLDTPGALANAVLGDDEVTVNSWSRFVRISAACVEALDSQKDSIRATELLTIAQWNLYIALTFPFRLAEAPEWLLTGEEDPEYWNIVRVFSTARLAEEQYFARLRDLEAALLSAVEQFQDHLALRNTHPKNLEKAVRLLAFSNERADSLLASPRDSNHWFGVISKQRLVHIPGDGKSCKSGSPKVFSGLQRRNDNKSHLNGHLELLIEGFFLPRFDLWTVWRAVHARNRAWWWGGIIFLIIALVLTFASAFFFIWEPSSSWVLPIWTWLALVAGAIAFLPVAFAPWVAQMAWLLRIPASVSIGALLLVTISSQWWKEAHEQVGVSGYVLGILILLMLAVGYVLAEARGHGVTGKEAFRRMISVVLIVFLYALLVTLIVFGVIFPLFAENAAVEPPASQTFTEISVVFPLLIENAVLKPPAPQTFMEFVSSLFWWQRLLMLILAASFISVVGLFSQVLWDEKAITAPLAHTSWRKS